MFEMLGTAYRQVLGRIAKPAMILAVLSPISFTPANAAGDLLIAPTRVILDSRRGAEVILNNIGAEEATYRVTLELRRMNDQGRLDDVQSGLETDQERPHWVPFATRRAGLRFPQISRKLFVWVCNPAKRWRTANIAPTCYFVLSPKRR